MRPQELENRLIDFAAAIMDVTEGVGAMGVRSPLDGLVSF